MGRKRRLLLLLLTAVMLVSLPAHLPAIGNREKHDLNKRHKEQRKFLKSQQRSMNKTLKGHALAKEDSGRYKRELKAQRRMLGKAQKDESRTLKARQKFDRKQQRIHA